MTDIPHDWAMAIQPIIRDACPAEHSVKASCECERMISEIITILRPLIEAETREALAACMIRNGVATGHGDTHADLIMELDGHFERHRGAMTAIEAETRERCAALVDQFALQESELRAASLDRDEDAYAYQHQYASEQASVIASALRAEGK